MSDNEFSEDKWEQAQQVAESRDTYVGEWSWRGDTLPLKTEAPSMGELEEMEEELEQADNEEAVQGELVNKYLVRPEVDATDIEGPKLGALFVGMQTAWSDAVDTSEIEERLPVEGNR